MNLIKKIFLITSLIVLLFACGSESKPMSDAKDIDSTPIREDNQDPQSEVNNWREIYNLPYLIACMDERLGDSVVREFQTGRRGPTQEEINKVKTCDVSKDEGQKDKREDDSQETQKDRPGSKGIWKPSPDTTSCLFSAIGMTSYRQIFNGDRLPTQTEINSAKPCLPKNINLNALIHPLAAEECPSLQVLEKSLREYRPRWDQLECHTKGLTRLPIPKFRTSARINPIILIAPFGVGCQGTLCPGASPVVVPGIWDVTLEEILGSMEAESWDQFSSARYNGWYRDVLVALRFTEEEFPLANASFLPMSNFPPYTDEIGKGIISPPSDYWHDQKLKAYAVHAIQRKQAGYITFMINHWPPKNEGGKPGLEAPAKNSQEFKSWINDVLIPQKIHEAKIAEILKVEMLQSWPTEIDIMVMTQPWANTASDQVLLDSGQYLLNAVAAAVRPYFKGRLIPGSFAPGQLQHPIKPRPIWKELSYKGFEEVAFTFFPKCDLQTSVTYIQDYMQTVMEIVKRDSISWSIGEMELDFHQFERCGTDLYDQSDEIYASVLDVIFDQEVLPSGVALLGIGNVFSREMKDVLEKKLYSKSND